MAWIAFVPPPSESQLRQKICSEEIRLARTWSDLDDLIRKGPPSSVIVDPTADGKLNIAAVLDLSKKFPSNPLVVCVTLNERGFEAGAKLAQYGFRPTLLDAALDLGDHVDRLTARELACGILGWAERSLNTLPTALRRAIVDLFERPHRYTRGSELGLAANLSTSAVYRSLDDARLGTPKKIVVVAKMTRAYHHLRTQNMHVKQVSSLVGFHTTRVLVDHTRNIFGCHPTTLGAEGDAEGILRALLDWLYKPLQ